MTWTVGIARDQVTIFSNKGVFMPIDVQCTACGQRLRVGDALAGKHGNCPKCKTRLTIPNSATQPHKPQTNGAAPSTATQTASVSANSPVSAPRPPAATWTTPATKALPAAKALVSPPDDSLAETEQPDAPQFPNFTQNQE